MQYISPSKVKHILVGKVYTISSKIANVGYAGTDSDVTVDIYGSDGVVLAILLDSPVNDFERNA